MSLKCSSYKFGPVLFHSFTTAVSWHMPRMVSFELGRDRERKKIGVDQTMRFRARRKKISERFFSLTISLSFFSLLDFFFPLFLSSSFTFRCHTNLAISHELLLFSSRFLPGLAVFFPSFFGVVPKEVN